MKILMLAPEFRNVWGGVGSYITELVANLPKSIEVHVVAPYRQAFGKEKVDTSDGSIFDSNVHVHYITTAKDTFFYNARFQCAVLKRVPGLIKREGIDLIHTHTAHMPDVLLRLFNRLDVPVVTTIHTTIKSQHVATMRSRASLSRLSLSEKMTLLLYPALRVVEELYLQKGKVYTTPSNYMKKWLEQEYPYLRGKIQVVPNAVDIEFWRQRVVDQRFKESIGSENIVLYVGRLVAWKGIYDLVRIIPRVLKENKDTTFVFRGTGERDRILSTLKRLGVPEKNYMFVSYLSRKELVDYYSVSTVLVLPSYGENMPMTILEAMSCSLPVIATNVGGVPEVIQHTHNGLLFSPGDLDSLTSYIILVIQDKALRAKLAHNARRTVEERFSWQKVIPQVIKVYEKAIEARQRIPHEI